MSKYLTQVVCLECKHEMAVGDDMPTVCPKCGSSWLDARYDYPTVAGLWPAAVSARSRSLWRYSELLPIDGPDPEISLGEGFTPLTRLYQYEKLYDHPHIYFKDERHQPTSSFKDRQAALSVTAMRQEEITECVLASTGNAAVAYAAYCARAGIKLWLFLTSLVPSHKMREAALYGAEVVKVSGTYDETKKVASEFAKRKKLRIDHGAKSIPCKESMKTLAFEIAEQLGLVMHPDQPGKWQSPDWYIQAVSGGLGPLGIWKGFSELLQMGMIDKMPRLGIIQAAGCAPMVKAFAAGKEQAEPVVPKTLITVLATGDPGFSYSQLREAALSNQGVMLAVEDGEAFAAMRHLASSAGVSVEPASAVAFAGLEKMLTEKIIQKGETVVINCSGHTFPAESHVLGDQYDKYILDLQVDATAASQPALPRGEGLGSALQNLDEQVTTIVIVDDNANDRRLIRRLLQSYKRYRIYEAHNGTEALKVIAERKPDLVVSDLTMPDTDGFTLLEELRKDPATADIPVVVISGKSLSVEDRKRLDDYSESIWLKGGFDTRQLVDHVVSTLGHTPVDVIQPERKLEVAKTKTETVLPEEESESDENAPVVIIIDDNPRDSRLVRRMLQSSGNYHIIEENSGRDGLKAIYNYHPDLIILDLMLPDMDGFSILSTLQKDLKLREIPVIVFSAKSLSNEERNKLKENIRSIVQKSSINRREFVDIIKNELE